MTTRAAKLKEFRAHHLIEARAMTDDALVHLMAEYGSHVLCGPLACSLDAHEAKKRQRCDECVARASLRMARSA